MSDGSPPVAGLSSDVPAWLRSRRDRQVKTDSPVPAPPVVPRAVRQPEVKRAAPIPTPVISPATIESSVGTTHPETPSGELSGQTGWKEWLVSRSVIGLAISLLVHSVVLLGMALVLVASAAKPEDVNIWGVLGDTDEVGSDIVIDTSLPVDPGESAPMQVPESIQITGVGDAGVKVPESTTFGFGGQGHGKGTSGNGSSVGLPTLKIPGHAQTKGSFSAWCDPRDPEPGDNYEIVIQVRLPSRIKSFPLTDLSGFVHGTDSYEQRIPSPIMRKSDIKDGVVEVRIPVPGANAKVRDTIQVKSKMLNEKQTFEIEF